MRRLKLVAVAGLIVAGGAEPALAKARPAQAATGDQQAIEPVLACRALVESAARLACFDKSVGTLAAAAEKHDIVVIDQQQITKVRRSLFGFTSPTLDVFARGKGGEAAPEEKEFQSTVRSAMRDGGGNWIVTLEDGAVWHQTGGTIGGVVRAGDAVVIRRAALTSFFMRVGNRPGVRARREG